MLENLLAATSITFLSGVGAALAQLDPEFLQRAYKRVWVTFIGTYWILLTADTYSHGAFERCRYLSMMLVVCFVAPALGLYIPKILATLFRKRRRQWGKLEARTRRWDAFKRGFRHATHYGIGISVAAGAFLITPVVASFFTWFVMLFT